MEFQVALSKTQTRTVRMLLFLFFSYIFLSAYMSDISNIVTYYHVKVTSIYVLRKDIKIEIDNMF